MTKHKGKRYTEDQILKVLQKSESGTKLDEICRENGISTATFYRWKEKYSGMNKSELAKAKQLESENARLKRLLAERDLEIDAMKAVIEKKW